MQKDIGRYVDYSALAVVPISLAAGTSMSATTSLTSLPVSVPINRLALPRLYRSCILDVPYEVQLPTAMIATLALKLQTANSSAGGTGWADFYDPSTGNPGTLTIGSTSSTGVTTLDSGSQSATAATASGAAGLAPVAREPINLNNALQWIQAVVTPTLQSSSSGYFALAAVVEFGGAEELASTS